MKALILGNAYSLDDYKPKISDYTEIFGINRIFLHEYYRYLYTRYIALDLNLWRKSWQQIITTNCKNYYLHDVYLNRVPLQIKPLLTGLKLTSIECFGNKENGYGHAFTSMYPALQILINDLKIYDITIMGVEFATEEGENTHFFGNRTVRKTMAISAKIVKEAVKFLQNSGININVISRSKWNE